MITLSRCILEFNFTKSIQLYILDELKQMWNMISYVSGMLWEMLVRPLHLTGSHKTERHIMILGANGTAARDHFQYSLYL